MKVNLLVACVLLGLLVATEGCLLEEEQETVQGKVKHSDVVIHGTVLSEEKDSSFPTDVYSVKFEVLCIYKGGPVKQTVWIDQVGTPPGPCRTTSLTVGEKYLLYLRPASEGRYIQDHLPDPADQDYFDEFIGGCEIKMTHPIGYKTTSKDHCPKVPEPSLCSTNVTDRPKSDLDVVSSTEDTVPANPQNPDDNYDNSKDNCTECPPNDVFADPPTSKPDGQGVSTSNYTMKPIQTNTDNSSPYTPMEAPQKEESTGETNASVAVTWNMITLLLVWLSLLL